MVAASRKPRRGVDLVVGAVHQRDLDVDDRVAGSTPRVKSSLTPSRRAGMYSLRHRAADDLVLEHEAVAAAALGSKTQLHFGVLTACRRLLLVRVVDLGRAADRLAVGDLRLADVRLDLVLALHAVDDDLEVQLAHARIMVWPVSGRF